MTFDWQSPDYTPIFRKRVRVLERLRADPAMLASFKAHYATDAGVIDFIRDWGTLHEPRNAEIGLPAFIPFIPFPRQVEWLEWALDSWRNRRPGVTPKSRESGVSWLSVALACTLCLFKDGINIGFGSRKEEYVDLIGAPKSLFHKARMFLSMVPPEFRNGFDVNNDAPLKRILFRANGSSITGEVGDNIGRGDRATIYFIDEAHFLEHPQMVEGGLQATTNCPIYISTANGVGGPFYDKVMNWERDNGPEDRGRVFWFHWRDDPRKGDEWYARQLANWDPVTIAREVDIDFSGSAEGILIPSAWVNAAINAHAKLDIEPTGSRVGALDVADEGVDKNAFAGKTGILVDRLEEWSGVGSDIFGTVNRAFLLCDQWGLEGFRYDSDGLGAGVRGDARVLNDERGRELIANPFRGSGTVIDQESEDYEGRKNKDLFKNRKAQEWWRLRTLFQTTFRAVTAASAGARENFDPSNIISLDSSLPGLTKLCAELSQPTFSLDNTGKIVIDKAPEGTRSPNLADAVMIVCAKDENAPMRIHGEVMEELRAMARRRR